MSLSWRESKRIDVSRFSPGSFWSKTVQQCGLIVNCGSVINWSSAQQVHLHFFTAVELLVLQHNATSVRLYDLEFSADNPSELDVRSHISTSNLRQSSQVAIESKLRNAEAEAHGDKAS